METTQTISTPPAAVAANRNDLAVPTIHATEAPSVDDSSGWMVLLRIVAYLLVLPAAIMVAARYLFELVG